MRSIAAACVLLLCLPACGGDDAKPVSSPAAPLSVEPPGPTSDGNGARAVALAAAAMSALDEDPALALLLAREGARIAFTPEVAEALHRAREAMRTIRPFARHLGSTLHATFAPDGSAVLTTSLDFTACLWDLEGRETALLEGHGGKVRLGTFSPDGERVLTASVDHTARLWDRQGNLLQTLRGHTRELVDARFAPDGERVITVSLDGTARLWNQQGQSRSTRHEEARVLDAWCAGAGPWDLLALREPIGALWWNVERGTREGIGGSETHVGAVPDAQHERFVILTEDPETPLAHVAGHRTTMLRGHEAQVLGAAFSRNGTRIATASLDGTARTWDMEGRTEAVLRGHDGAVFAVSFSPDGNRLLSVASDRTARLWSLDGSLLATIGTRDVPVVSAVFSPNGESILTTAYEHGPARLWDLEGRLRQVLPDDTGRTMSAMFSADGMHVLTLDRHLTPHVWIVKPAALVRAAEHEAGRTLTNAERSRYADLLHPTGDRPTSNQVFANLRPSPDERSARGDYAGTVTCSSCHREAYEQWVVSSHARTSFFATEEVLPEDVLEGRAVEHPPGRTTYMQRPDGDGWIARTTGEDGEEHDYDLTMVSGHLRIRFFMTRLEDGRLQVLPAMYELPTGKWFDYTHLLFGAGGDLAAPPVVEPGSPSFWTGPVRSWDAQCAHCHMSGKTPVEPGPDGTGPRILARAYAVDCEACHGPGRLHAEAWTRLEMDETLTKLETLPRGKRIALCTQCHQEGEVLDPPHVPGKDLYEFKDPTLAIDPERADPAGRPLELIYDGLPFAVSTCANAGGLTCSDCHAPHGSEVPSLLRRPHEDGSFCAPCHGDLVRGAEAHSHHMPGGSGATCVACHMPFLTIERGHGAVADHTIGIPRIGLTSDRVQPDACTWCHTRGLGAPEDAPLLDEPTLRQAYESWWPGRGWPQPWMAALANARRGDEDGAPALEETIRDTANPVEARASAARLLGRYAQAQGIPEAILAASYDMESLVRRNAIRALADLQGEKVDARLLEALSDPSWAVRVAAARTSLDGWTRVQANRELLEAALPVLDKDARRVPDDDRRWFRLGAAYDLVGDMERALDAYERKIALDPFSETILRRVRNLKALLGRDE